MDNSEKDEYRTIDALKLKIQVDDLDTMIYLKGRRGVYPKYTEHLVWET